MRLLRYASDYPEALFKTIPRSPNPAMRHFDDNANYL